MNQPESLNDIYLLRHPRSDIPPDICYGHNDNDMVQEGFKEEQVLRAGSIH